MATIKILSAENGEVLQNIDNNIVKLTQNSVIQVNADIDEVVTITRQGNSAVIQLKNGESIIIENYFDYPVDANRIVFENEGKLYWAEFTDQNGEMLDTILYHPLTEDTVESTNMAAGILPWLGGALAIGAIAAAAGSGGSSGGDSDSDSGSRDNTPPKLTGIIVNENGQLELSFNENVNGSNPRPEDFTVIVDGEEIPVTNIIVEGDKITLVTEPAIQDGQEVTVDYQDSTPNNNQGIKDSEGNVLDGLDSDAVGGVKNPDITAPTLLSAEVNKNGNIELSFNEALNADNLPPTDSLVVTVGTAPNQTAINVIDIIADGNILTLITDPVISTGQSVNVVYTDLSAGNDLDAIQDTAGNDAAGFSTADLPNGVVNNSDQPTPDTVGPTLLAAEVNKNGNIELSFNEALDADNLPPAASLVVTVGTAPDQTTFNVIDVIVDGNILTLITDPVISAGQSVNVVYTDPSAGNDLDAIQDIAGNDAAGFNTTDLPNGVVNNSDQQDPDVDAPVLIDAEVNENGNIELSFNEDVSTSNPLNDDFTVTVDGTAVPVIDLLINGSIITLITDPEITQDQVVEVSYSDSTPGNTQGIQDSDGNVLEGFDAADVGGVENNSEQQTPDVDAPVLIDAEVNENGNIELSFNEDVSSSNPLNDDFTVTVDGTAVPVIDLLINGSIITLITDPEITQDQVVEVSYSDSTPGNTQGIQDSDGNVLEGFDAADVGGVENNSEQQTPDVDAPVLIDAEVNENGNIELSFNEDVSSSNPLNDDFTVTVDGTAVPVIDLLINGSIITLITDPEITQGQVVEVSYSDSTPGNAQGIQDSDGNVLEGFDAADVGGVENNSEQQTPDVDAPVLIDAEVNENGNIELSFNETLNADNLPPAASLVVTVGTAPDQTVVNVTGISADGNTLTLITDPLISAGQSVNVVYTDPSAGNDLDAIQDTAGNDAAGFNTADLPNGVVNNVELPLSLANDEISALLVNKTINTATPLATIDEQDLISVLPGDSRIAVMNFTIDSGTEDVVIAVQQDNLVDLAGAFTFVVRNAATGEEFQVAAADTSQGGLVAGALGLELLGGVADAQGLRLDISDLPAGNYEVSIYGDSSQLADILATVDLASLGDNTVNNLVSDTVLGLLETALTGPDADPRGLLEQLTLSQLLEVTTDIPALGTLTGAVNTILAPLLNNPLLGDLNNTSVGDIIAGNAGGALGFLLTTLGLGTILNSLVNGVLAGVDGAGQALFDNLVEPLVRDILLDTVLEGTGLTTGLNSLLGSVNTLLDPLGLDNVLPTVDGLLDLVAQEILSNPLTLLGGTTAEVYAVGETYRATGNIQETSVDGTQADNWGDGVLTAVKGVPVTFDSTDADGNFTLIQGTYGVLKLYDDGSFIYNSNSLNGQGSSISEVFSYTVTRNAGQANEETASADLTINIDPVNQIINYADDSADNLLQGGAGNDILTGGAGADTAIYYLLNNTDATGGNDTDTWTDFNTAEGDIIDVSALLSDQPVNASNLGSYITLDQRGDDTIVMIDRDGSATDANYTPTELIILQNTDSTSLVLEDLIKYNQI
ncbi:SwmB domain-containing protein [Acinetobacter terrestris]|uniref:BapA prefix-like domain-containing protein n=1 Tax=Acinetobacter terrestris TaxID=2529843 RepID=A0ABX1UPL9_9GAMM|nr:SwmB domain-containing protein [Acinetobacter terrestris]NNH25170.1 BapA prefix-like domain-containing protein [Acinetobacter terrestris]